MAILGLCFIDNISKHMYNLCIDKHNLRIVMKERIKQLAIEANLIASEPNGFDQNNLSKAQQKFAELIVRECAEMVRIQNEQFMENESHNGVVSTDVLKHFGFE